MEEERERGWLKRALKRASKEVEERPIWMKPEEMRLAVIQKKKKNEGRDSGNENT
jgi:hypothetical protein